MEAEWPLGDVVDSINTTPGADNLVTSRESAKNSKFKLAPAAQLTLLALPKVADLLKFCGEFFKLYYLFKIENHYRKLGFGEKATSAFLEGSIACELAGEAFASTQSMALDELKDTGGERKECGGLERRRPNEEGGGGAGHSLGADAAVEDTAGTGVVGDAGGTGVGSRRGERVGRRGGGRGRGFRHQLPPQRQELDPRGAPFRAIQPIIINVPVLQTAPSLSSDRFQTITNLSTTILSDPALSTSLPPYDPTLIDQPDKVVLYHGTRQQSVGYMNESGISPPYWLNECSPTRAFYATNNLQFAYTHPLFTKPRIRKDQTEFIAIVMFAFEPAPIHGERLTSAGQRFTFSWFEDGDESFLEVSKIPP